MENRVKKQVKMLLLQEDLTLKALGRKLEEATGKKYAIDSFSHRLSRESLTYKEMLIIADILGYEIKFEKVENY